MFLDGIPVPGRLVSVLATLVKDPHLAERLEAAVKRDAIVIRLYDDERASLLKALVEPPPGLEDVRAALTAEQARRQPVVASNAA